MTLITIITFILVVTWSFRLVRSVFWRDKKQESDCVHIDSEVSSDNDFSLEVSRDNSLLWNSPPPSDLRVRMLSFIFNPGGEKSII